MGNIFSFDWVHDIHTKYNTLELIISYSVVLIVFVVAYYIVYRFIKQHVSKEYHVPALLYKFLLNPGILLFGSIGLWLVMEWAEPFFLPNIFKLLKHIVLIILILSLGLFLSRVLAFAREVSTVLYNIEHDDNLSARKARTQFRIIERVLSFVIAVGTVAFVMMTFETVRSLGTTILASAGVIGIIIGFAAQKSISTLVAGIQIAITQPIRIDDVVIVEGEWGRIEELTLTYVVVALWDKRRLIVPINYFIEKPFQNWTRTTSELLATVFIYMDYTVPVEAIRSEVTRLLQISKLWNGEVNIVQVTNVTATNLEVRILISAENSDKAYNLRCEIRESIITFLQKDYPGALPKTRVEFEKEPNFAENSKGFPENHQN
jgi:small-conductance mechanosensitive channel